MSTNFYYRTFTGPFKGFKTLHIGKRSGGWQFTFQAYDESEGTVTMTSPASALGAIVELPHLSLRSAQDWKDFMSKNSGRIEDEYGTVFSNSEFWQMVDEHAPGKTWVTGEPLLNHFDELVKNQNRYGKINPDIDWKDAEGFSMTLSNFS